MCRCECSRLLLMDWMRTKHIPLSRGPYTKKSVAKCKLVIKCGELTNIPCRGLFPLLCFLPSFFLCYKLTKILHCFELSYFVFFVALICVYVCLCLRVFVLLLGDFECLKKQIHI